MFCRSCGNATSDEFLNLAASPAANSFLDKGALDRPEPYYPLVVYVCNRCLLVQIAESKRAEEIFTEEYVYFSSYSEAFVQHARQYVEDIVAQLQLNKDSFAVEAGSNDGYLLQFFNERGIRCLGVEPSASTAKSAREKGVETIIEFFGTPIAGKIASERGPADLFIGNNVIAHVPDLNGFIGGIEALLKPDGVATIEFPHLLNLIKELQFDTIYHEHYSYFSLLSISKPFERHGMYVFKIDEIPVHGGSLRVHCAKEGSGRAKDPSVEKVATDERAFGLYEFENYFGLQAKVDSLCLDFLEFLIREKKKGAKIIGYGAAAKGNALLNYCGVKPYLIDFVADITPAKQNKFLPGSRIPVYGEDKIEEHKPDYIVILPWNWEKEIKSRLGFVSKWGGKFVTVIPALKITEARR